MHDSSSGITRARSHRWLRGGWLAGAAVAATILSACLRVQLVPPAMMDRAGLSRARKGPGLVAVPRRASYPGGVVLRHLTLRSETLRPSADERRDFRHALSRTLETAFPRTDASRPALPVDVVYHYETRVRRWIGLDLLHTLTLGFVFVSPEKGIARVTVRLAVGRPAGDPRAPGSYRATLRVEAPYLSYFTPWYDRSTRQKQLDQAHDAAFRKVVEHVRWWLARRPAGPPPPPAPPPPPKTTARRPPPAARPRTSATAVRPRERPLPPLAWHDLRPRVDALSRSLTRRRHGDELRVAERVEVQERRTGLAKLLRLLGGLAVGYSYGAVWARSDVQDDSGRRYTVASGRGVSESVGVSFHGAPRHSGIYLSPVGGFLWEQFRIADVGGLAALAAREGSTDIGAIATDPDQPGHPAIDLATPWSYRLIMTSVYLGLRAGAVLVWGQRLQYYLGAEGGANLLEWRWMDVRWDRYRADGHRFAGAGSFAARLITGFTYRPWHLTVLVQGLYEHYRAFEYPEPVPFRGRVAYDASLDAWQRPVQRATGLSLHALRIYCAVAVIY